MYKNKVVLPLVRLIHEAVYKVGIRLLPIKWQLNGCPLSPTACLTGGGSLAERVGQGLINSH